MSSSAYLIFHKDHPLNVRGVNSGAETATLWLARAISRTGRRVVVCGQLVDGEETREGVEYWDLGPTFDVTNALVRARELGAYHLISACRAQAIMESRSEPSCLSRHFTAHDPTSAAAGIKPSILSTFVDTIICVSEAQAALFIQAGADPKRVRVIPNGADLDLFKAGDPETRDYQKIVFVGALVAHKGIDILVQAFARISGKHPKATLDIYGSSKMWDMEQIFDPEDVTRQVPQISFKGSVPQSEVADAFRTAGMCVIPSRWFDSFPLTAVEAQVSGCPVVAFDVGGIREAIQDGKTGVLLSEISDERLSNVLDELLSNPERLKMMSKSALNSARQTFTWERAAQSIIDLAEGSNKSSKLKQKKIGFLSTWNQECGLATYGKYMISSFESGSYVVFAEEGRTIISKDEDFVERCWSRGNPDYSKLASAIKQHDIGLLHLNCHHRFFVQPAFGEFVRKLQSEGITVISLLHTIFTKDNDLRALLTSVDGVIVHSPENRLEAIANGADPSRTYVLPHGVFAQPTLTESERTKLRTRLGIGANEKAIVSFGFVQPHKGMEAVLESVAYLASKGIPARGFIAGKPNSDDPNSIPYQNTLKQFAQETGITGQVNFLDRFLTDDEMADYLRAADVVVLNYRSQHYEASGACSLSVGAGVLVATSIAPPFLPFHDAVFHITAGFPAPLAVEALLTDEALRGSVREKASEYVKAHRWDRIKGKLFNIYREFNVVPTVSRKESRVVKETPSRSNNASPLRVLMHNRSTTFTMPGGDTMVMQKLMAFLKSRGVEVTVDLEGKEDPKNFDVVHIFNFAIPELVKFFGERAKHAGVPFVVTTLYEDIPTFHTQSQCVASALQNYVLTGQSSEWWEKNRVDIAKIHPSPRFENGWAAENASALFTNGDGESRSIKRDYPKAKNIVEVKLGYDIGVSGDAEAFVREYGVKDFILCVGRLESRKNQLMLLKALEHQDIPVVFAGGGFTYQPEYERAVKSFKRKGKTIVLPRVDNQMLANAYAAAKVHALPSWYELPGLVSLEAAYYGCNVVATRTGTTQDYLGERAFYASPGDEESILNAVVAAYYSPVRADLKEVVMTHTWEKAGERTLEAYESVSGKHAAQVGSSAPVYDMSAEATEFQETLEKGELAARNKELTSAHEYLEKAERMNAQSVRVLRARGAVFLAESNYLTAETYFRRALQIDGNDPKTLSGIGMCEMMKSQPTEAYGCFLRALEIQPSQQVAILQLIECAYTMGKYDDLERVLRRYNSDNPGDVEMEFCLAGCLYKLQKFTESQSIADAIKSRRPDHRGNTQLIELLDKEITSKSASHLVPEKEVISTPAEAPTFESFNSIDQRLGDLDDLKRRSKYSEVKEGCQEVLKSPMIRPDQRETALLLQAEASVLTDEVAFAESVYDQVLEGNPSSARAMCGRGAIRATKDDWAGARGYFEDALRLKPEYDVALAGLGLCSARDKNFETGWAYYTRALRSNCENLRALLGIIETGYILNRLPEVEGYIRDYLELHPADLDFVYSLAGCYFAQGKLDEAKEAIDRITLFDPNHKNALELKGMIDNRASSGFTG